MSESSAHLSKILTTFTKTSEISAYRVKKLEKKLLRGEVRYYSSSLESAYDLKLRRELSKGFKTKYRTVYDLVTQKLNASVPTGRSFMNHKSYLSISKYRSM